MWEWVKDKNFYLSGSILEGPDVNNLKPLVEQAMPMLIECLKDQSVIVRDTGAWTIGRVCEILPEAIISEDHLRPLLLALVEGLESEPRVASNVCWVSNNLNDVDKVCHKVCRENRVILLCIHNLAFNFK